MFGIGTGEVLALAVIALLVVGPDKLPKLAADAARMIRQLRVMANSAKADVRRELGPELQDISLDDLNPRTLMRKHLFDDLDIADSEDESPRPDLTKRRPRPSATTPDGGAPPYDAEAT